VVCDSCEVFFCYIISFEDNQKKEKEKEKKEKEEKKTGKKGKKGAVRCVSPLLSVVCCDLLCAQARVSSTV